LNLKTLIPILSFIMFSTFLIGCVFAETETFTVPALHEVTRNVGLTSGDKISGSIVVAGGGGNDINFYATDPDGNVIFSYDHVTQRTFSFTASKTGTYILHFDNSFSMLSSKTVTLDYSVTPSIFGLPRDTFLYVIITIIFIIVIAILAFVLIKRRKT